LLASLTHAQRELRQHMRERYADQCLAARYRGAVTHATSTPERVV
jgi:hypothetical protein